ncbi:transporter substrate-binding domain-containing protein [Endozoicomonas sp. SM1973]|uniref:Transporter substrate-binding domain-containing protein n=1 Tax=Spartinivicinus marinus TaxID=2994442 RepID=A0A853IHQ0_9GAMM|nr:transporter substrate-binding domain-containing protein [Spartinivicinus marinus]MCX4030219.1 transporter substrate-binding domain-containing protein [Spartinivicinus marinus]NYZ69571.1 transporter substrate-binding domain-containing protein [Spartinivicinus marinus]
MTLRKILYLIFASLVLVGTSSYSEELLITGNAFKKPKIWKEGKESKGILVDIMKYAGKKMDLEFKVELYPWARAYHYASNGKVGIVGLSITQERLKIFDYSVPLYYDEVILVVKRGNEFKFENNEDLRGKIVGACRGCSFGPEYEKAKKYFKLSPDENNIQRLIKLLKGRIEVAVFSPGEAALNSVINKANDLTRDQFSILDKPITRDPNYLAFAKKLNMKDFLSEFNKVIKKGYDSGAIQKIIEKY